MTAREDAVHLAQFYFRLIAQRAGMNWDSDNDAEIELLVCHIIDAAQRDLRDALERIADLERLRPTCTVCHDATATQQTASGPACAECVGDPADDHESEPRKRHTAAGVCWCGDIHADADAAALYDDQKEEPGPDDYDLGPEVDDEGGMSEYRYVLPEDYGRGQS
jgi:hypothetical protein